MPNRLRPRLAACAAGLGIVALAGCSVGPVTVPTPSFLGTDTTYSQAAADRAAERTSSVDASELLESGVLTVGIKSSQSAPFSIPSSSGSRSGVDIEVAYAMAEQMGLAVKFVDVTDTTAVGTTCDVVMGVAAADAGTCSVLGDYAEDCIAVFSKGGSTVTSTSQLSGKTIGVQAASASQKAIGAAVADATYSTYVNLNEAFAALDAGTIEYVCCGAYPGAYLAAGYDGVTVAGVLDTPVALGVAVDTTKATLTQAVSGAIDSVQTNGQLEVIKSRWVDGIGTLTTAQQIQAAS